MKINEAIESFINEKDHNSISACCGFFDLSVNEVLVLTKRSRKTLEIWVKNDRDMLLIVLIGCHKLSKK